MGASGMCFLPFGHGTASVGDGTFFHERHSREPLLRSLLQIFPVQQRELGAGSQTATERLFSSGQRVIDLNAMFGTEGLEKTVSYNEFWRPYHLERQLFAPLAAGNQPLGYVCVSRSATEPSFGPAEIAELDWLSVEALGALQRLAGEDRDSRAVLDALAALPLACAVFDSPGTLMWISRAAQELLESSVIVVSGRRLVEPSAGLARWRDAALRAASLGLAVCQLGDLLVQRCGQLLLVTHSRSDDELSRRIDRVRATWRLTPREAEVLEELSSGRSNKEIGTSLGCSSRTVDVHVSSLLVKSRCTSRTELLAQLWSSP
jgi:DNA-binding CsgD family transcriptional regulator